METLTQEQIDYILERFNNTQRMKNTRELGYLGIDSFYIEDIKKILNKCIDVQNIHSNFHETGIVTIRACKTGHDPFLLSFEINKATEGYEFSEKELMILRDNINKQLQWFESK